MLMALALCYLCLSSNAQDNDEELQAKSGVELIAENDTSDKGIPDEFPLDKKASIYAKRQGKRLGLDNTQVLRLTVRRLAFLKRMEIISKDKELVTIEQKQEQIEAARSDYYKRFYELLNAKQRHKALQAVEIATN